MTAVICEPHTAREIGLGTLNVRSYLDVCHKPLIVAAWWGPMWRLTGHRVAMARLCSSRRKASCPFFTRRFSPSGSTSR